LRYQHARPLEIGVPSLVSHTRHYLAEAATNWRERV
jgi:hypothetical protein